MTPLVIVGIVAKSLEIAATLLEGIGDVVNARKVRDILDSADFPAFARRAAAAGEAAKAEIEARGP